MAGTKQEKPEDMIRRVVGDMFAERDKKESSARRMKEDPEGWLRALIGEEVDGRLKAHRQADIDAEDDEDDKGKGRRNPKDDDGGDKGLLSILTGG